MARKAAKDVRGTERYRDERRASGGPRMHQREWHDHDEPHDLELLANSEGFEAIPEVEASGNRAGMRRMYAQSPTSQGGEHRKRTVPPSKGKPRSKRG